MSHNYFSTKSFVCVCVCKSNASAIIICYLAHWLFTFRLAWHCVCSTYADYAIETRVCSREIDSTIGRQSSVWWRLTPNSDIFFSASRDSGPNTRSWWTSNNKRTRKRNRNSFASENLWMMDMFLTFSSACWLCRTHTKAVTFDVLFLHFCCFLFSFLFFRELCVRQR